MSPPSSQAKATDARGVTVLDVLQAIVRECVPTFINADCCFTELTIRAHRCLVIDSPVLTLRSTNNVTDDMVDLALLGAFTPDGRRRGKWLNKADCLEGFRRYEGLEATRDGLRANAVARLSSQPVAGEFVEAGIRIIVVRVLKVIYNLRTDCAVVADEAQSQIRDFLVRSMERKIQVHCIPKYQMKLPWLHDDPREQATTPANAIPFHYTVV
ncbi:hypothetical protein B0H13DRAFT_2365728 [Mycena leptocephala]|nr:hypothetical protein B0H13DRAFT_2365728 [Mycena leptocephala]